jgi:hypothetical protein
MPATMTMARATYEVTVAELRALRSYVAELARPHEAAAAERLLGQLAALAHHHAVAGSADLLRFTPVPAGTELAGRAFEALRTEGDVRMGGRRWRLHRPRSAKASKSRLAPGRSPGEGVS